METCVAAYKALSDGTRLRILALLAYAKTPLCVCELVDSLEEPQYHISRSLRALSKAGVIDAQKEGRWVYYQLPKKRNAFLRALIESVSAVSSQEITKDRREFKKRLKLREGGKCLRGVQKKELLSRN